MIPRLKNYRKLILLIGGFLVVATYVLSLNSGVIFPSLTNDRQVLSTVFFSPNSDGLHFQVIKVKVRDKILVEIYKIIDEYNFHLVSQIETGSKYEGYFLLGGNATNLAYLNIDDDSTKEIIVPGFDNNLTAQLNVVKFDSNTETFTLLNQKIPLENR